MFEPLTEKTIVEPILTEEDYFPPKIFIEFNALVKMKSYVENCDKEIAWLGLSKKVEDAYVIYDVDLQKQETSAVSAEIHEEGLQEYANLLIKQNRVGELENVRVWGHSHVNMNVEPSETDEETFEEYYKNCSYFIRIIANKKAKLKLDIALKDEKIIYKDVQWIIKYPENMMANQKNIELLQEEYNKLKSEIEDFQNKRLKEIEKDTKEKIEKLTKTKYTNNINNYSYGYGRYDGYDGYNGYSGYSYYEKDYPSNIKWEEEEKEEENWEILITDPASGYMYEAAIDEVLSPEEIAIIAETKQVPKEIRIRTEFTDYIAGDWEELIQVCESYWGFI